MELKLKATLREANTKLNINTIPAVLYGKGIENKNLQLNRTEFEKLFQVAGESNLIDLDYGSEPVKVVVKDTQRDIIKSFISHVDFYQVNMKEKIKAEVPLSFIGESRVVRELGGMLIKEMDTLEVECLPGDLIDHIDINQSVLDDFDDAIRIGDIKLSNNIIILNDESNVIISAKAPRIETEEDSSEVQDEEGENEEEKEGDKEEGKEEASGEKKEENKK